MNDSTPMSTTHAPPQQRPAYPPPNVSYRSDFGQPNGRPSPVNAPSPQMMTYNSPSPQQPVSPQFSQPAAKRPRLSPDAPSPFSGSPYPQTPLGQQVRSPAGGASMNGNIHQPNRPGSMAPPQRPQDRDQGELQNGNRDWQGVGANPPFQNRNPPGTLTAPNGLYPIQTSNIPSNNLGVPRPTSRDQEQPQHERSAEEQQKRLEQRADWEAARHMQNELWDMFLIGGGLNDRIRQISHREHLQDPQHGVLINTQKNGPAPIARVVGQEGANRVIDKGQAILDTTKGERLAECLKLVSLATKARLSGLISSSSRLALERREHSKGRIPLDWQDVAVAQSTSADPDAMIGVEAVGTTPLKRKIDQVDGDSATQRSSSQAPENVSVSALRKMMQMEKASEDARRAKRAKRKAATDAVNQAAQTAAEEAAVTEVSADTSKKAKKASEKAAKNITADAVSQQINAAAQMAMSNLGRKGKSYSWMTGGGSGASTPLRPGLSSTASTPKPIERPKPVIKEKVFGAWDEDKDPGIQARDVLLVLETDGKAPRAYTRGYSSLDK